MISASSLVEATQEASVEAVKEARRQTEICNACRYCEGYCSVFPAAFSARTYSDADITQLANLCHNCRGCFYACQYTAPHEFDLNLPQALAKVRSASWAQFVFPGAFASLFQRSGVAIGVLSVLGFAAIFAIAQLMGQVGQVGQVGEAGGAGFYAVMSHSLMVAIFAPAFLVPLVVIMGGLWMYWCHVGGKWISISDLTGALGSAARMKNLGGGHGEGCNFESEDKYSNQRRMMHQLTMYGFLLCFASTSSATILHYVFDYPAPYAWWTLPKLFGVTGGVMMSVGAFSLAWFKTRGDKALGDEAVWGGEMAFVLLLGWVGLSGLLLYWMGQTPVMATLLALHLGAVLTLFLLMPYSKMVHGFFRLAALVRDEQRKRLGA